MTTSIVAAPGRAPRPKATLFSEAAAFGALPTRLAALVRRLAATVAARCVRGPVSDLTALDDRMLRDVGFFREKLGYSADLGCDALFLRSLGEN